MIRYYKRVVSGDVKELHTQEDFGEYIIGKSYPESEDSFYKDEEMFEIEVDEWLDEWNKMRLSCS